MKRISTPTREIDKFGAGKDGFNGVPPNQTELEGDWFDHVQEQLCRAIEGQGFVLDAGNLDQLTDAIDSWSFDGTPTIAAGAILQIEGAIQIVSGGALQTDAGSVVVVNGDFTCGGPSASFQVNCAAMFNGDVQMVEDVTIGNVSADALTVNSTSTFEANASFNQDLAIVGASGGTLSADSAAIGTWNGTWNITSLGRFRMNAGVSAAAGDMSRSGGILGFHDGTSTRVVQLSQSGGFKLHGKSDAPATAATVTITTSTSGAPQVSADVDVLGMFMVQRVSGAGDIEVTLTTVGVGTIGTTFTVNCPYSAGTQYFPVIMERVRTGADTTARSYSMTIDGLGSNVAVRNARITAECSVK